MILFDKPPQEVDSIGFASDAHQVNAHSCERNRSRSDAHSMRIKVPMWKRLWSANPVSHIWMSGSFCSSLQLAPVLFLLSSLVLQGSPHGDGNSKWIISVNTVNIIQLGEEFGWILKRHEQRFETNSKWGKRNLIIVPQNPHSWNKDLHA